MGDDIRGDAIMSGDPGEGLRDTSGEPGALLGLGGCVGLPFSPVLSVCNDRRRKRSKCRLQTPARNEQNR